MYFFVPHRLGISQHKKGVAGTSIKCLRCDLDERQGEQIGRTFGQSALVFFGQVIEKYTISPNVLAIFSTIKFMY
jgi:hypothetical protein